MLDVVEGVERRGGATQLSKPLCFRSTFNGGERSLPDMYLHAVYMIAYNHNGFGRKSSITGRNT